MGRLMAEVTENLDERPLRALKAVGVPSFPLRRFTLHSAPFFCLHPLPLGSLH